MGETLSAPAVSVILPVYNGAADVESSIDSILRQTFTDFELLAIDDCSPRDNSLETMRRVAAERNDPRLRIIALEHNHGLAGALNHGIGLARGRYIARQDQDDISLPERLAKEVAFLDAHPRCGLVGTRADVWVDGAPSGRALDHSAENALLQHDLLVNNPFVHASVMLRREVFDTVGLYTTDKARQPPEDFELWSRVARNYEIANIPERLMIYREVPTSMSRAGVNPFLDKLLLLSAENFAWWTKRSPVDAHCADAAALLHAAYERVSKDADIDAVCQVITQASKAIAKRHVGDGLAEREQQMLNNARHHYVQARVLPDFAGPLVRLYRQLPLPASVRRGVRAWLSR